jgi:hypothetical protein
MERPGPSRGTTAINRLPTQHADSSVTSACLFMVCASRSGAGEVRSSRSCQHRGPESNASIPDNGH